MENANGDKWREELFQKMRSMKEMYLPHLNDIYQIAAVKFQHEALPQQQRSEQFDKLKQFKTMLERAIQFLSVSKSNIKPALKDKVADYEKSIIRLLNILREVSERLTKEKYNNVFFIEQRQLPQIQENNQTHPFKM